jgi:hypothetical protein
LRKLDLVLQAVLLFGDLLQPLGRWMMMLMAVRMAVRMVELL